MTEAELFELVFIAGTTALTSYSLFITFCFAYLTAAYFLGSKFSPLEVSIVSVIHLISVLLTFFVMMATVTAMGSLQQELAFSEVYQRVPFFLMDARIYIILTPIVSVGAVVLCYYFMWRIRHPKTE